MTGGGSGPKEVGSYGKNMGLGLGLGAYTPSDFLFSPSPFSSTLKKPSVLYEIGRLFFCIKTIKKSLYGAQNFLKNNHQYYI